MNKTQMNPGPIHDQIHQTLLSYSFYQEFLSGDLDRTQYAEHLTQLERKGEPLGIASGDLPFASRFPINKNQFVRHVLDDLHRQKSLSTSTYDEESYSVYEKQTQHQFWHGDRSTYIATEEAQLLHALCDILKPKNVAFLGSYYGYWAHWALPKIQDHGGQAWLVDVDAEVAAIAQKNIDEFGFQDTAQVIIQDAVDFCEQTSNTFDMVVIDAECPRDHPNPSYRGKSVYVPILESVLPKMNPNSVLVFHNIIFRHFDESSFFENVIARNHQELNPLLSLLETHTDKFLEYESTEGIGIGFVA